ncbi:hypothetical protein QP786_08390, partial [Gleimia europaea]|nr:hypothetical protein [Gleimia europaea]
MAIEDDASKIGARAADVDSTANGRILETVAGGSAVTTTEKADEIGILTAMIAVSAGMIAAHASLIVTSVAEGASTTIADTAVMILAVVLTPMIEED